MSGFHIQTLGPDGKWVVAVYNDRDAKVPTVFATREKAEKQIGLLGFTLIKAVLSGEIPVNALPSPNDFRVVPAAPAEDPPVASVEQAAQVLKKFTCAGGV